MRVIVIGTRGFPNVQGGVEKHCEKLYPRLVEMGCKVTVFTRRSYVNPALTEYKGVSLVALPTVRNKTFEAFFHSFIGILCAVKFKPDILHIQGIGSSVFTPLARLLGMRVILTTHGPNYKHLKWGMMEQFFLRICELIGIKTANRVIAISDHIGLEIRQKYGRDVVVIPNGVDLPLTANVLIPPPLSSPQGGGNGLKAETVTVLQKFGVEKGKYVIAVGRFVPEKGVDVLMEAFKIASSPAAPRNDTDRGMKDGWKLVIVGDADHEDAYSRKLKEKSKENPNVVLTGFLTGEPLQEVYSNAGLFVLPSYYEGLPIVLLEAMSYGLSCVVSDIPANREVELVEERYFKAGDVEGMARKLREFMGRPLSAEEKNAQIKLVAERYDWDKIAGETLKVYEGVVRV